MNILIVFAHPPGRSLNDSLRQAFKRGLEGSSHKLQEIDLYAEGFDPVMTKEKMKNLPANVKKHQQMIKEADLVVFFYPIWWFRAPAILEGWFDHVIQSGFAFKYRQITKKVGIPLGLLKKDVMVFETYGAPWWGAKLFYCDLAWRRIKRGVFKFTGCRIKKRFSCFSAPFVTDKKVKKWLKKAEKLARRLK